MKPFKSYEEQLEILKTRNLIIENEKEALEDIKDINYYNIINGYKTPFLKRDLNGVLISPETFIDNCNFKNLISLYNLDKELKSLLFGYLLEFERTLKSYIAYIFSEEYSIIEIFKKYQNNFTGVKFEDIISLGGFPKIEFLDSQK